VRQSCDVRRRQGSVRRERLREEESVEMLDVGPALSLALVVGELCD
jgi:hypothetical protein